MLKSEKIRKKIFKEVKEFWKEKEKEKVFSKRINYAGQVFDGTEMLALVDTALDSWYTGGKKIQEFENSFSKYLNIKHCLSVNSGSSANLLAFFCLTSPLLGEKRISRGDEIITASTCFPTTLSPIMQYGAIPVFIDVNINTLNIDISYLKKALSKKTKAIFLAHSLGNPFNISVVKEFCKKYNLWIISDECDALGTKYDGKYLDHFADISTHSFFAAHGITCGHGGMVCTDNDVLYKILLSMRSWGRDFKCNICKKECKNRFNNGYDCRYTYSNLGFNFQITELQAAIGIEQLKKLDTFITKRKQNFNYLYSLLQEFKDLFIFLDFENNSDVVPFCFPITLSKKAFFSRKEMLEYLEKNEIETRLFFSGNIIRQKVLSFYKKNVDYKSIGNLKNSDYIMKNTFFIGIYPKLNLKDMERIYTIIKKFIKKY